jgi:RNA polymerase sigma-70 factor (ECF subfamily)
MPTMTDLAEARRTRGPVPALGADPPALFETHRRALTGYCYRMLGTLHEAEDAVQETMVRAWRSADRLDGPSAVKPWLYRIATNVCLTMLGGRRRRALPMDLVGASSGDGGPGPARPEATWIQPVPETRVLPAAGSGGEDDPAERAVARESIRLAFVAALQHLPARQRAVLILRDVLRWRAAEVAELLDTTVVSVNSALRRARAAIAERGGGGGGGDRGGGGGADQQPTLADPALQVLLERYVDAFERFDVDRLVALLHEDVTLAMPPYDLWLQGSDAIVRFFTVAAPDCRQHRFLAAPTRANGSPTFGIYTPDPDGAHAPFAVQVVELVEERIAAINAFLDPGLFPLFGLPATIPGKSGGSGHNP